MVRFPLPRAKARKTPEQRACVEGCVNSVILVLRLKAFEVHDLVLAKLARNIDRDREDVRRLAEAQGEVDAATERCEPDSAPIARSR